METIKHQIIFTKESVSYDNHIAYINIDDNIPDDVTDLEIIYNFVLHGYAMTYIVLSIKRIDLLKYKNLNNVLIHVSNGDVNLDSDIHFIDYKEHYPHQLVLLSPEQTNIKFKVHEIFKQTEFIENLANNPIEYYKNEFEFTIVNRNIMQMLTNPMNLKYSR